MAWSLCLFFFFFCLPLSFSSQFLVTTRELPIIFPCASPLFFWCPHHVTLGSLTKAIIFCPVTLTKRQIRAQHFLNTPLPFPHDLLHCRYVYFVPEVNDWRFFPPVSVFSRPFTSFFPISPLGIWSEESALFPPSPPSSTPILRGKSWLSCLWHRVHFFPCVFSSLFFF